MSFQRFRLVPMHEERDPEKDDWSGLSDAKERRKRQNRLNQRTARRRQRLREAEAEDDQASAGSGSDAGSSAHMGALNVASNSTALQTGTAVYFPLTPDHRLLHVIAANVSRAIFTNYFIVSSIAPPSTGCCSGRRVVVLPYAADSIACPDPYRDGSVPQISFPPSLLPTKLQQTIPHVGWVDLFPSPQLRDNLILAMEEFSIDADELMDDLTGCIFDDLSCSVPCDLEDVQQAEDGGIGLSLAIEQEPAGEDLGEDRSSTSSEKRTPSGEIGIVSWSDPWDINGWEITDKFVAKWGFLLQGCPDVLAAANNWRDLRGEDPLVVEL